MPSFLALLLLTTGCGGKPEEEPAKVEVPTIAADTAKASRQTLVEELVVRGTIAALPNEDVKVSALVPGRIVALPFSEGDAVRQGQMVAQLDRQPLEDQRRQATAAVDLAKAQLENARLNLQRDQQLFERGIAAGKEVEDARTTMATAQSALEQATASLNMADRGIDRADIRSPIAGQIVKRLVNIGEQVDGTAGQPIVEIANLDRVELAANVPADSLPRIKVGQKAVLSFGGANGPTFSGSVLAIAPSVDPITNAAVARIRVANPDHSLKIGMFAEARLRLTEHPNALTIPPAAVVRGETGAAVYIVTGDVAVRTAVKIGLEQPDAAEILEGISEGQTVLTSSVHGLGDRAKLAKPAEADKPDTPASATKPASR